MKMVFIGAGSMAEAMIAGIIQSGFVSREQILVTNKQNGDRLTYLQETYGVTIFKDREIIRDASIVILSTKPYDMQDAIAETKDYILPDQLVLSVIAGMETGYIGKLLGDQHAVVRAMPNTSASIGQSATAIAPGEYATEAHMQLAETLFQTIGETVRIEESLMHAVTSVSGSGPAYFYYMVEALEQAAEELGLQGKIAKDLIIQTIIGAGEMLKQTNEPAAVLREKITSPNGTTEAGIRTLEAQYFQEAIVACVKQACQRSMELGKIE
ncbi:pyrroline-5-carboxylate reductase [Ornithinibacillus gellani]|uniref:pyrroline-5-carboxylate reductase n=1 Tax=Ornithinibacillus gellani TaxID=2293253 RepID=UPI000F46CBF3|nr:pyrroline-5-carboxylate reductase [Ornithinibacillus gellani]TQS76371.1 pyrroline-5-carboxylate reductase [Ornithinibacillus gellani]